MERFFTSLIASLCTAPLLYFLVAWYFNQQSQTGGPDARLGNAYLGTWLGFLAAGLGLFVLWFLAYRFLTGTYLRHLQLADALGLLAWGLVWGQYDARQPKRLEYNDHQASLEVEVRAARWLLSGKPVDAVVSMDFVGGDDLSSPHPDRVREEEAFVILPWETAPISVKDWAMRVFVHQRPVLFTLNLPRRPTQSTEWSDWVAPTPYQDEALTDGVRRGLALRYRFRLIPYGTP